MSPIIRRGMGLAALTIALIVFLWGVWPLRKISRAAPIQIQDEMKVPAATADVPVQEAFQVSLDWPGTIRVGDTGSIRLELEPAGGVGQLGTGSGGEPAGHWLVQARLDLGGAAVVPPGDVSEPLRPGRPALFQWNVQPKKAGLYQGTLWIYSRPVPGQAVEGELAQNRQVLSAQRIEFRAISLFGLGGTQARILGFTAAVLALLVTLETFLTSFWKEKKVRTFER